MNAKNLVSALLVGLLAIASASAAALVFTVSGTLADGSSLSGTISIDNTAGTITAQNVKLGPPDSSTCGPILTQLPAGGGEYAVLINCSGEVLELIFPTDPAGDLIGYVGGPLSTTSFYANPANNVTGGALTRLSNYLVRYAANLASGTDSVVNIINTGENGNVPVNGPGFGANNSGNICVNVYAVDPEEELISCCSCLVTPNQVVELQVHAGIMSNTLTGTPATSVTLKLLGSTNPAVNVSSCTNSAATVSLAAGAANGQADGFVAFGTTVHGTTAGSFAVTETPFIPVVLSTTELSSLTNRCATILGNASGFGICTGCTNGALGANKK